MGFVLVVGRGRDVEGKGGGFKYCSIFIYDLEMELELGVCLEGTLGNYFPTGLELGLGLYEFMMHRMC